MGQVDDLSAPLPGLFKGAEDGTEAYFDYINSMGGVNGRKIKLDAQDSAYSDGTGGQRHSGPDQEATSPWWAGSPSTTRPSSPSSRRPACPTSPIPSDPDLSNLPHLYSPAAQHGQRLPVGHLQVLKEKYPQAVKKVGIIWANATASTKASEKAAEAAKKASGFRHRLRRRLHPFQTDFLPNVLDMKAKGVQLFFTTQMPDNYAATLAEEMQQQNFSPVVVQGDAYSTNLVKRRRRRQQHVHRARL